MGSRRTKQLGQPKVFILCKERRKTIVLKTYISSVRTYSSISEENETSRTEGGAPEHKDTDSSQVVWRKGLLEMQEEAEIWAVNGAALLPGDTKRCQYAPSV